MIMKTSDWKIKLGLSCYRKKVVSQFFFLLRGVSQVKDLSVPTRDPPPLPSCFERRTAAACPYHRHQLPHDPARTRIASCPHFRKGGCKRGDGCEFAQGVFEPWLHPARRYRTQPCKDGDGCEFAQGVFESWLHPAGRYRTQPCKDGTACRRRVCFFAHTTGQLRAATPQQQDQGSRPPAPAPGAWPPRHSPSPTTADGSPLHRQACESYLSKSAVSSSPNTTLVSPPRSPPSESPPLSPDALRRGSWPGVGSPVNDVLASLWQLRLASSVRSATFGGSFLDGYSSAYGSPRSPVGLYSLPSMPTSSGATLSVEPPRPGAHRGGGARGTPATSASSPRAQLPKPPRAVGEGIK
jgi:hypothetical protein